MSDDNARKKGKIRSLDELVIPRRPSGIPYPKGDDFDARALLTANGYTTETPELTGLFESGLTVLQAAAARLLGVQKDSSAIMALTHLAHNTQADETVRVQAAYALVRMDVSGGYDVLVSLLKLPPEASPAPLQAAGILARLNDPQGFPVVQQALYSHNRVTAMIACKQLYAFIPLDGHPLPGAGKVDIYQAFKQALARPEANIAGEAQAQLAALDLDWARTLLSQPRHG
jgi:hypothetical protein